MIIVDEEKIFDEIRLKKPASVSLNGPDGILPQIQSTAINITEKFGIPAYVLADTTWGTCDLNSNAGKILGTGLQFNIGHTINTDSIEKNVILIDAFDDINFDNVAEKCSEILSGKTIALVTDSQHLNQMEKVKEKKTKNGVFVKNWKRWRSIK